MIAVFICFGKLDMAIQIEAMAVGPCFPGQDDLLVRGLLREDDAVGIELAFGKGGDPFAGHQHRDQQGADQNG
ncbi:MAG: hypothetical protein WGN25_01630 [Candidatus Electrothrix sp. GW3-4]|uniref:hypothetical protein n=1 Tax=Candidatus Electrothrix sp. GW3-4 TaxID=3126740 RepID=UPI0030CEB3E2